MGLALSAGTPGCGVSNQDVAAFFKTHEGKSGDQIENELGEPDGGCAWLRTHPAGMSPEQWRTSEENIITRARVYGDYVLYFNWFDMAIGAGRADELDAVLTWRDGFGRPELGG
jgi:hypothetical protein